MRSKNELLLLLAGVLLTTATALSAGFSGRSAVAAEPKEPSATQEQVRFFESRVRPLLAEKCYACHGPAKQSGDLRLDSRSAIIEKGALVPGSPERSRLIQAVNHAGGLKMPPGGKLKPAEIVALTQWVRSGAHWPGAQKAAAGADDFRNPRSAAARSYWAFQPVRRPPAPAVVDGGWSRNPIDRFVFQRLKAAALSPSPEADRPTLIRRLSFDLTGLPPTPSEVDAFVSDPAPDAYEKLVDRLLASPRYGERWARHWLDLVRYADSDGYRIDDYRPNAWLYRDYVIRAFNEDKPYDRFVQEQLAGDEMFPGNPEARIATGYLRHWIYEYNARDVRGQWTTILNDLTDTTGDVFLGMGLQCARCHDHKFDPILQKDYYRLQAFFAPILPRDDLTAATPEQEKEYAAKLAAWEEKTADLRRQIEELEAKARKTAAEGAIIKFTPDLQAMIRKPAAQRTPFEHQLAELAYRQVDYEFGRLEQHLKGEEKEKVLALRKQLSAFDKEKPAPLPRPACVTDIGAVAPGVYIPKKGNEPIEPGFLTVLEEKPAVINPLPDLPSTGRRSALARWLTRPDNPLTSRVIVNRVWQYHFGRGLAANASDFGKLGDKPTHPELLDYLASRFTASRAEGETVGRGDTGMAWSLKALHRLIVTSATYRQSATPLTQYALRNAQADPENKLYWRGSTHRLQAEQIRDAMLAVTGELDGKAGGPGVDGGQPRRTIYVRMMRNNRDPLLDVFDLPLFFNSASSRDTTTTPVQSLLLINSQSMLLRSKAFARRVEQEAATEAERITLAYRLAYGRAPSSEETAAAKSFLREQAARINPEEAGSAAAAFRYEKLPYRDGQAAVISPKTETRLEVPADDRLSTADFTIEGFFLPRSVYESGWVRTLVSRWNGSGGGWAFGVTGKGSRRKPQTLVIQLWGKKLDGSFGEAALFSDQHVQINKPYYAGVAVQLAKDGKPGSATFYLKDLSNDDEPLLVARVEHTVAGGIENRLALSIGGREKADAYFDGLIDDVRLSRGAMEAGQLLYTAEAAGPTTIGYWPFEPKPDVFADASGHNLHIRPGAAQSGRVDPERQALADFCHALLNSNEFLYVD